MLLLIMMMMMKISPNHLQHSLAYSVKIQYIVELQGQWLVPMFILSITTRTYAKNKILQKFLKDL
jgi:hypothetical protein